MSVTAVFSRAKSADMRLSLAFSASRSRSRCHPDTRTPEYLLFQRQRHCFRPKAGQETRQRHYAQETRLEVIMWIFQR